MKIYFFLLLFSAISISSFSQKKENSTYLFNNFQPGTVIFKSGITSKSTFNYELVKGKIHFKNNNEILELANPQLVKQINIGDHIFEYVKGDEFYEKISFENIDLYIKHKGTVISQGKNSGYGGRSQTASIDGINRINTATGKTVELKVDVDFSIKKRSTYYLKIDGKFKSFNSVNSLAKLFDDNQEQIKETLNNEKINFENTDDVIKAVKLCEQYLP